MALSYATMGGSDLLKQYLRAGIVKKVWEFAELRRVVWQTVTQFEN